MELKLQNLKDKGLKCNIEKSFIGKTEMEYLGFWVTWTGIKPINKKVESMVNMMSPKNTKEVHASIGIVNYYRDMWYRWSPLSHPLTSITSNMVKFKWADMDQKVFDDNNRDIAQDTLLEYTDFNKRFLSIRMSDINS